MRFVVLLRGVNAGPRNRVSMAELRAALAAAGFGQVRTWLQSGNAIVTYERTAADVEAAVRGVLTGEIGVDVEVVVRDEHAWRAIVSDNPLGPIATDGSKLFVVFCSAPHDPSLLPDVAEPERLVARPTELHVWCPNGVREGRVMAALGRRPPAPVTTFRNWNTVAKMADLLAE